MALDSNVTHLDGLSVTARPGAIAWDGRTAHEFGPVARSDVSDGLAAWAWRAYIDGNEIWIQRETDARDGWRAPELLTTYSGAVATALGLTFDQNGRAWAAWEQDGQIGLYWYDTQAGTDAVRDMGAGRTPTLRLDTREPQAAGDSDILLFYINDAEGQVEYLRQRDRLDTVFATNLTADSDTWLELLAPARNNRLYLWFTRRAPQTGEYTLHWWHSAPYRFFLPVESGQLGPDTIDAAAVRSVIVNRTVQEDLQLGADTLDTASVRLVVKDRSIQEDLRLGADTLDSAVATVKIKSRTIAVEEGQLGPDTIDAASAVVKIIDRTIETESGQLGPDTIDGASVS